MPNATVRANARTLPEATNRRAVLGGLLAAGAASLPLAAAASIPPCHHPDADLFALIDRAKVADSFADDACVVADNILQEKLPSFPEALIWSASDVPQWCCVKPGKRISDHDIDFLRGWLKWPARPDTPIHPDLDWSRLIPSSAFVERAQEIVRSNDEYQAARQAAENHPDVIEAEDRSEALKGQWCELAKRVATTPAKTPEGLIAKITLIASGYAEDDLDGTYDGILASAALDA
jgi:hypothetical protein